MKKLSVSLSGHQTSVSLEDDFLIALREIALQRKTSIAALIAEIDASRKLGDNLSSAIRVWILNYFRS
ncbi:MAG: ribbon-helix-helix domain-containing protein [Alphaproteobacteria bacterium]|nr:ribbon-helix-helix domain-containing protein [Alphaproteobacteria bacterium]